MHLSVQNEIKQAYTHERGGNIEVVIVALCNYVVLWWVYLGQFREVNLAAISILLLNRAGRENKIKKLVG